MPRRKIKEEPQMEPVLALPSPHPVKHHEGEDPYKTAAGAVPAKVNVRESTTEPIKRKLTKAELAERTKLQDEKNMLSARYNQYLDSLAENEGDQSEALAAVFGVSKGEAALRFDELHSEVMRGFGGTDIAKVLERNDLHISARVRVLRQHVYSGNAAASLSALKLLNEQNDSGSNDGNFEAYLRLAKASTK